MIERERILQELRQQLANFSSWSTLLGRFRPDQSLHLAIMREPFLSYIVQGEKRVESRFSRRCIAPFKKVKSGEIMLFKRTGGKVEAVAQVADVKSFHLRSGSLRLIRENYGAALCATGDEFWSAKSEAKFATLICFTHVTLLDPGLQLNKRDRRGWVVL